MSQHSESGPGSKSERALHAYHDGALGDRARRRFERRLEGDPVLARELELLQEVGALAREVDAEAETPDLWGQIALRLPAEEVLRSEARAGREGRRDGWRQQLVRSRWPGLVPLGAVAAAALVVLLLTRFWITPEAGFATGGVVRWVDAGGRSVMVMEDDGQTGATLIWLLDSPTEGAAHGESHETA